MALPTTLVRDRSAVCFIKAETTPGTLPTWPSAGDAFLLTSNPNFSQKGLYATLDEIGADLMNKSKVLNFIDYTDFTLEFYAKPSGTAGTAPDEDLLLTHFFGTGTNTPSTKEEYTFSNTVSTSAIYIKKTSEQAVQLFVASGCIPTSLNMSFQRDGAVTYQIGMRANRVYYAGTAEVSAFSNSGGGTGSYDDQVTIDAPERNPGDGCIASDILFNGMQVEIVQSDGTALSGGAVTAKPIDTVSTSAGTFEVSIDAGVSEGTPADGDLVLPYLPSPTVSTKSPLSQNLVAVYISTQDADDGTASNNSDLFHADNKISCTGFNISFDRGISSPMQAEMDGDEFSPASYLINGASVTGSITMIMRPVDMAKFESFRASPNRALGFIIGSTAGSIIEMYIPAVHMEIPDMGDFEGAAQITIPFELVRGTKTTDATKLILRYR